MVVLSKHTNRETGRFGVQYHVEKILIELGVVYRRSNSGYAAGMRVGSPGFPDFDLWLPEWVGLELKGTIPAGKRTPERQKPLNENQCIVLPKLVEFGLEIWLTSDPEDVRKAITSREFRAELVAKSSESIMRQRKANESKAEKMARKMFDNGR